MNNSTKPKNTFLKRALVTIMMVSIMTGSLMLPNRAHALFGIADVVHDPVGWFSEAGRFIATTVKDIYLAKAKKALLDMIADQIIGWISGEGDPKFITDPGGSLARIADNAIGQTIEESQLGGVCQPFSLQLKIGLGATPQRFPERISCTLGQVVSNFEDFYNNFGAGGFPAFNRLIEPQNNYFGAMIIGLEEINSRTAATQNQAQIEQLSNEGYLSTKKCIEYTDASGDSTSNGIYDIAKIEKGKSDYRSGIRSPEATAYQYLIEDAGLRCSREETTTPGTLIAKGLEKSVYADLDSIITSDNLTPYLAAILDAAIGRLIGAGLEGLSGIGRSGDGGFDSSGNPTVTGALDDYSRAVDELFLQSKDNLLNRLKTLLADLNTVSATLASAESNNNLLIDKIDKLGTTDDIIGCLSAKASPPILEISYWRSIWNTAKALNFSTLRGEITSFITDTAALQSEIEAASSFSDVSASLSTIQSFLSRGESLVGEVDGTGTDIKDSLDAAIAAYNACRG